jgi:hypothetical protein
MFHFQVLKNGKELEGLNPDVFCREVGVLLSYRTEFTKMISLAGPDGGTGSAPCLREFPRYDALES